VRMTPTATFIIPVPPFVAPVTGRAAGLAGAWLSEGSSQP
jgi:hypothetical protein